MEPQALRPGIRRRRNPVRQDRQQGPDKILECGKIATEPEESDAPRCQPSPSSRLRQVLPLVSEPRRTPSNPNQDLPRCSRMFLPRPNPRSNPEPDLEPL